MAYREELQAALWRVDSLERQLAARSQAPGVVLAGEFLAAQKAQALRLYAGDRALASLRKIAAMGGIYADIDQATAEAKNALGECEAFLERPTARPEFPSWSFVGFAALIALLTAGYIALLMAIR